MTKLRIVEAGVGLLLLTAAVGSYFNSRLTAVRADAEHKANALLEKEIENVKADYDKRIAANETNYVSDKKKLDDKFAQASKHEKDMAALLQQAMHLPAPVVVTTPPATPENPKPAPVAVVPQADWQATVAYTKGCEDLKLKEGKCEFDLSARVHQMQLAQKQIETLQNENKQMLKAAHGTFWGNLKKSVKWFAIGAAAGGAAVCGTGHCR